VSFEKKVTIAHLSDLHFASRNDHYQMAKLDAMLGEFVRRRYDHLVMTGDLIDTAAPALWTIIREALVRHGLFDWSKTTVIPGNHDLIDLEEEMRVYNALNPSDGSRKKRVNDRLRQFNAIFQPLISGNGDGAAGLPFVKVMRFGEIAISFVAVSTVEAWSGSENPVGARGSVSRDTLRAITEPAVRQALEGTFAIGLCHHAYKIYGTGALVDQAFDWTMEFKNRDEYLNAMQQLGIKLVLHGHFHRFQVYQVGDIHFINGGCFRFSPERYGELTFNADGSWSHRFVNLAIKRVH
jgi:Icc protein